MLNNRRMCSFWLNFQEDNLNLLHTLEAYYDKMFCEFWFICWERNYKGLLLFLNFNFHGSLKSFDGFLDFSRFKRNLIVSLFLCLDGWKNLVLYKNFIRGKYRLITTAQCACWMTDYKDHKALILKLYKDHKGNVSQN